MKVKYDREEDILVYEISDEKIDYAEEMGPVIVHFTKDSKPVMLEILDASEFLTQAMRVAIRSKGVKKIIP
ncbi:MAG: DUF2283 domain-containing protein [Nitrososphaerales archaeon]